MVLRHVKRHVGLCSNAMFVIDTGC